MLKFDKVTKEFQDGNHIIEAVKPTSLSFEKAELIAIVLPSGSRKITFSTMAGALQTLTFGEIYINGPKISKMSQKQLPKMRMKEIGFIRQATNLVPFLMIKQQFHLLRSYKKGVLITEKM